MKKRDKDELHKASVEELTKKVRELKKQILEAKLSAQTKEVKNKHELSELRRRVAITMSIKRAHELVPKESRGAK